MKRAATSSESIPVHIDGDSTPLPMLPPNPADVSDFDDLPTGVRSHLKQVYVAQQERDVAISRMWGSRHAADQIGDLRGMTEEMLRSMRVLVNLPAAFNAHGVHITEIRRTMETMSAKFDRALELLDQRLDQVERTHIKLEATLTTLTARIGEVFTAVTDRVDQLDEAIETRFTKHETSIEKQAERIKSLEEDRTKVKAWAALIAVLASIGAFLIGKFVR